MFKNYLLVSFRNLYRNKIYSAVNIFGLVIGTVASILVFSYFQFETNYDDFFENSENIYRITLDKYQETDLKIQSAQTYTALGPSLKEFKNGIVAQTRVCYEECLITFENDRKFNDQKVFWADETFFDVFSFEFINGSPGTALTKPNLAVVNNVTAQKFFGNDNPIGKTVILNEGLPFLITGVVKSLPSNSHMAFDFILSLSTGYSKGWSSAIGDWNYNWVYTYIRLEKGTEKTLFEKDLNVFTEERDLVQKDNETHNIYHLQPITNIHLDTPLAGEFSNHGSRKMVYMMGLIGILILIIAWINFLNLCTARATDRAKEAAIRKVNGATKSQLMGQYILESLILNLISGMVAIWIAWNLLPTFSNLLMKPLAQEFWSNHEFWVWFLIIFLTGSILSGIYPALVLAKFDPLEVLKSRSGNAVHGNAFRKILVIIQFTITIVLISATYIIYQQFKYLQKTETGIDSQQVLVIKAPRTLNLDSTKESKFQSFREQIIKFHTIKEVAASNPIPGMEIMGRTSEINRLSDVKSKNMAFGLISIDHSFVPLFNIPIMAGRNYSSSYITDTSNILINEQASTVLGFEKPDQAIGETVLINKKPYIVIGVLKNYSQEGLKKKVIPTIYCYDYNYLFGYYSVKLETTQNEQTLAFLKDTWDNNFPKDAFDYFFVDTVFAAHYAQEKQTGRIFAGFSIVAIVIACLGLLGLISYISLKRAKEISLRKILGASAKDLFLLLTKDLAALVCIASAIGLPLTYFLMSNWLNTYPYRIELQFIHLLIPIILLFVSALLSISYTIIKTMVSNPIESIRYE